MEKPSWSASPLRSRWKYSLLIDPAHGATAPSPRLFSGSGMTSSGSTSLRVPMPVHSGQAPKGELKENDRGSRASNDRPSSTHARCSEKVRSRCGSSSARSTKSRTTSPPARPSAVSTESVSRRLALSLTVRRSTITSIVCFSCFLSFGGSVSGWTTPSTRTREKPCVCSELNRSTYSPLRARRSEEHTSELQSRQYLVCRLLLEKKK